MGIDSFFHSKRIDLQEKVIQFRRKSNSKQEERAFERKYLKPDPPVDYAGKLPVGDEIQKLSVRFVFHSREDLQKFGKHFKLTKYIEQSATNIQLLMSLVEELEKGNIIYDERRKKIRYKR